MGLAGRREKQVITLDPRNTKWANDTSNPGHRLLANMGWKAADGTGSDASASESDSKRPKTGLMAHESTKRLRKIPIPKSGNEGIGYRPNTGAAANVASGALPGSGAGGSMSSAASSVFSRLGSKAALQFVSAGASKEVINKAKTEGGEFAGLLQRLNAAAAAATASTSASPSPASEIAEGGENEEDQQAETKEQRRERRRKRKAEREEQRAAKKARKLAKGAAPTISDQSEAEEAAKVDRAIVQSATASDTAARPMLLNPRMAYVLARYEFRMLNTDKRRVCYNRSRARHLASKRMLHASADALAEILGISPSPSSTAAGTPYAASSLPSTMPPSKAASPAPVTAPQVTETLIVTDLQGDDASDTKARRKAERKAAKAAKRAAGASQSASAVDDDPDKQVKKKRKRET